MATTMNYRNIFASVIAGALLFGSASSSVDAYGVNWSKDHEIWRKKPQFVVPITPQPDLRVVSTAPISDASPVSVVPLTPVSAVTPTPRFINQFSSSAPVDIKPNDFLCTSDFSYCSHPNEWYIGKVNQHGFLVQTETGITFNPRLYLDGHWRCEKFFNQAEAQAVLRANPNDPNGLDPDGNGLACESNNAPYDRAPVARTRAAATPQASSQSTPRPTIAATSKAAATPQSTPKPTATKLPSESYVYLNIPGCPPNRWYCYGPKS